MEYLTHTLSNGLRLVHLPSTSPVGYCGFAIQAGTRDEEAHEHGLAHFVEHMIFKGTDKHFASYILNRMETVGGELNAYTTKEETFIYSIFLVEHFRRALDLLAELVFHSVFPEEQIPRETDVILDELHSYEDSPSELIFDEFENLLFEGHALGHNILGDEASLQTFHSDSGKDFLNRFYTPSNMVFFSMGNIAFDKVVAWAEDALAGVAPRSPQLRRMPPSALQPRTLRMEKDTHQAHVMIGCRGYDMHDDRRIALFLLNNLLGGPGMNNRLNLSLREQHGLVYNVESNITSYTDTGVFSIYFGTDPKNLKRALNLVRRELDKLCAAPLSERKLQTVKRQAMGQLGVSGDNKEGLFLNLGKSFLHYNRFDSMEEVFSQIQAVSAAEMQEIACALFAPENLFTLIYEG